MTKHKNRLSTFGAVGKRVLLSALLLSAASLVLLLSDLRSRQPGREGLPQSNVKRVALLKHASNQLLDELEQGVLGKLAESGYKEGERLTLRRFCAEGDLPTANAIAKEITNGRFDMVITVSTLSLQCVANANKDGRVIHVFGGVTDPVGAGVGIRQMNSTNKPPWLAGLGTFQPVDQLLAEARLFWPDLKVIGVVWNPAERNSEACVSKARETCKRLGLQLLEATAEQSKDAREATESLVSRGAQAIWTGFDVTVLNATAAVCETASKARIPVFSNTSGHVRHGTLCDLGADYLEVGRAVGGLAASILDGRNPASIMITNFMPERLMLSRKALKNLQDPWRFPDTEIARAEMILDENGQAEQGRVPSPGALALNVAAGQSKRLNRRWRIQEASYLENVMVEDGMRGLRAGLKEAGLIEGTDYTLHTLCAQGDMASLGALFDSAQTAGTDIYIVYGTPTLQNAVRRIHDKPIVFTVVADPFLAGAGKTDTNHLDNVTGVYTLGPYREMSEFLHANFPQFTRVGTLFCPAEANAVANKDLFTKEAANYGISVDAVPVNSPAELSDAALALCGHRIQAVVQVIDNLCAAGFPAIARAASSRRVPVFACQGAAAKQGAVFALARDYCDAGRETAVKAVRIMRGESPAAIPFSPPQNVKKLVNLQAAGELRLSLPQAALLGAEPVSTMEPR